MRPAFPDSIYLLPSKPSTYSKRDHVLWYFDKLLNKKPLQLVHCENVNTSFLDNEEFSPVFVVLDNNVSIKNSGEEDCTVALLPQMKPFFFSYCYKFSIVLDLTESAKFLNMTTGRLNVELLYDTLKSLLLDLVCPVSVGNGQIIFKPDVYVSIFVNYAIISSGHCHQTVVHGFKLDESTVNELLDITNSCFFHLVDRLSTSNFQVYSSKKDDFMNSMESNGSVGYSDDESVLNLLALSESQSLFNMINFGVVLLEIMDVGNAAKKLIIVTDGILGSRCPGHLDACFSLLTQRQISLSFVRYGMPVNNSSSLFVALPNLEFLDFVVGECSGVLIDTSSTHPFPFDHLYHLLFLGTFFTSNLSRDETVPMIKEAQERIKVSIPLIEELCIKIDRGFCVNMVQLPKDEVIIELSKTVQFFYHIHYILIGSLNKEEYCANCSVEVVKEVPLDHPLLPIPAKSVGNSTKALFTDKVTRLMEIDCVTDKFFNLLDGQHTIPENLKRNVPIFSKNGDRQLSENTFELTRQIRRDQQTTEFSSLWKPIISIDPSFWSWFLVSDRIYLLLEHDYPLPTSMFTDHPSLYEVVSCRLARNELSNFLADYFPVTLVENRIYLKYLKGDANNQFLLLSVENNSTMSFFVMLKVFFSHSVGRNIRNLIITELSDRLLLVHCRPRSSFSKCVKRSLATDRLYRFESSCFYRLTRPLSQYIVEHESFPYELLGKRRTRHQTHTPCSSHLNILRNALSRVFLRRMWVRSFINFDSIGISKEGAELILNTIMRLRLQKGFRFAFSTDKGVNNLFTEIVLNKNGNTFSCLVQYIFFPVRYDGIFYFRKDVESTTFSRPHCELHFVTECWIEPQVGSAEQISNYAEIADQLEQEDNNVFQLLTVYEYGYTGKLADFMSLKSIYESHTLPSSCEFPFVCHMPFLVDIFPLLDNSPQTLILFSLLSTLGSNNVLLSIFQSLLLQLNSERELPISPNHIWLQRALRRLDSTRTIFSSMSHVSHWRCFFRPITSNNFIVTLVPADSQMIAIINESVPPNSWLLPLFIYVVSRPLLISRLFQDPLRSRKESVILDYTRAEDIAQPIPSRYRKRDRSRSLTVQSAAEDEAFDFLSKYCEEIRERYDHVITKAVYDCVRSGITVEKNDIDFALSSCQELSKQIPLTDYLSLICGHLREPIDMLIDPKSVLKECLRTPDFDSNVIHLRFKSIVNKYFKPIENYPEIFVYSEDLSESTDESPNPSECSEMNKSISSKGSSFDLMPASSAPLFATFSIRLICRNVDRIITFNPNVSIPLCIVDMIADSEDTLLVSDLSIFLDVISMVLCLDDSNRRSFCDDDEEEDFEEPYYSRLSSTFSSSHYHHMIPSSNFPRTQNAALNQCLKEIKWLLEDELVSAMSAFPFSRVQLQFVADHVQQGSQINNVNLVRNCQHQAISLKFVFGVDTSINYFRNELKPLTFNQAFRFQRVASEFFVLTVIKSKDDNGAKPDTLKRRFPTDPGSSVHSVIKKCSFSDQDISSCKRSLIRSFSSNNLENSTNEDIWMSPRVLPPFWILIRIRDSQFAEKDEPSHFVDVFLHFRSTEYNKPIGELATRLYEEVLTTMHSLCEKVNKKMLLIELEETRICHVFLLPEDDENAIGSHENLEGENYLAAKLDISIHPGQFACEEQWKEIFPLHPRLRIVSLKHTNGLIAVNKALNSFTVFNRRNMFVFKTSASSDIFYAIITENCMSSSQLNSDFIGRPILNSTESSTLSVDTKSDSVKMTRSSSVVSEDSAPPRSDSHSNRIDCVTLHMYGLSPPDADAKNHLKSMISKRLDEETLSELLKLVSRNPKCRLLPEDVQFIKRKWSSNTSSESVFYYSLPFCPHTNFTSEYMHYLRQSLQSFFVVPKFVDDVTSPIRSHGQIFSFIYTRPPIAGVGKQGICWIEASVSNKSGSVFELPVPKLPRIENINFMIDFDNERFAKWTTVKYCDISAVPDCIHVLKIHIWDRGEIDVNHVKSLIEPCLEYAVCDLITEYMVLSDPFPAYVLPQTPQAIRRSSSSEITDSNPTDDSESSFSRRRATTDVSFLFDIDGMSTAVPRKIAAAPLPNPKFSFLLRWFQFVVNKQCPSFVHASFTVSYRFSVPHILCQFVRWLNNELSIESLIYDRETSLFEESAADFVLTSNAKQLDRMQYNPGQSFDYLVITRDLDLWMRIFESSCDTVEHVESASSTSFGQNMRFEPFYCDPREHLFCVPRQAFVMLYARNKDINLYCYNWENELTDKLVRYLNTICQFHRKRAALLDSIVLQKLGLFHHRTFASCQCGQKFDIESLIANSMNCVLGVKKHHVDIDTTFENSSIVVPFHTRSKHPYDPIFRHGTQLLELRSLQQDAISNSERLTELYDNWIVKQKAPIASDTLQTLKQHCRCLHAVSTPLLFTSRVRDCIKSQLNLAPGPSDNSEKLPRSRSISLHADGEEESSWQQYASQLFFFQYRTYLESVGFVPVEVSEKQDSMIAQRTFRRIGILLIELIRSDEELGQFFVVRVLHYECSKASVDIFLPSPTLEDTVDRTRDLTHFNSFTYDFHLRLMLGHLRGENYIVSEYFPIVQFLHDFMSYYADRPVYAQNVVWEDVIKTNVKTKASQLYEYVIDHQNDYGIRSGKMLIGSRYANYIMKIDEAENYTICHLAYMPSDDSDNNCVLTFQHFLLLMRKREIFPLSSLERRESNFSRKPASSSHHHHGFWDRSSSVEGNVIKVSGVRGILSPHSNYLVGQHDEQALLALGQYLQEQLDRSRELLTSILNDASNSCLRDRLWERLIRGESEEKASRKRVDFQDYGRLSVSEFEQLLRSVVKVDITEIDSRLSSILHFSSSHAQKLIKHLCSRNSDSFRTFSNNQWLYIAFFPLVDPSAFSSQQSIQGSIPESFILIKCDRVYDHLEISMVKRSASVESDSRLVAFINMTCYFIWENLLM